MWGWRIMSDFLSFSPSHFPHCLYRSLLIVILLRWALPNLSSPPQKRSVSGWGALITYRVFLSAPKALWNQLLVKGWDYAMPTGTLWQGANREHDWKPEGWRPYFDQKIVCRMFGAVHGMYANVRPPFRHLWILVPTETLEPISWGCQETAVFSWPVLCRWEKSQREMKKLPLIWTVVRTSTTLLRSNPFIFTLPVSQ